MNHRSAQDCASFPFNEIMACPQETLKQLADRSGQEYRYQDITYDRLDETPWTEAHWYLNGIRYGSGSGPNKDEARKMAAIVAIPRVVTLLDAKGISRGGIYL
jgi:hypothetical protein